MKMFNKSILLSIICFSILTIATSIIKNKARNLEKDVIKLERDISLLKKEFNDAEIEYIYLSNPESLIKNIEDFKTEKYSSIDHSRIFFSINHFINHQTKESKYSKEHVLK